MINFNTGDPWVTRFAPSPTGALHLGNARTAIFVIDLPQAKKVETDDTGMLYGR